MGLETLHDASLWYCPNSSAPSLQLFSPRSLPFSSSLGRFRSKFVVGFLSLSLLFFSKMLKGTSSSTRVPSHERNPESRSDHGPHGIRSILTEEELGLIRARFFFPSDFVLELAGPEDRINHPPEGRVGVYVETLLAGLRFPFNKLVSELLKAYNLVPAQLTPNSWRLIIGFLSFCSAHEIPMSVRIFRGCFILKSNPTSKEWLYFAYRGGKSVFTGNPSSIHGWKERFFFVTSERPWGFNPKWDTPRVKENNSLPIFTGAEEEVLRTLRGLKGNIHLPDLVSEEVLVNVGLSPATPEGTG